MNWQPYSSPEDIPEGVNVVIHYLNDEASFVAQRQGNSIYVAGEEDIFEMEPPDLFLILPAVHLQ